MSAVRVHEDRWATHDQTMARMDGTRFADLESALAERAGTHEQVPGTPSCSNDRGIVGSFSHWVIVIIQLAVTKTHRVNK